MCRGTSDVPLVSLLSRRKKFPKNQKRGSEGLCVGGKITSVGEGTETVCVLKGGRETETGTTRRVDSIGGS